MVNDGPQNGDPDDPVSRPHDWDRVVDAASVFAIGGTLAEAAKVSGAGERTITRWRSCSWWDDAISEAMTNRLSEVSRFALRTVMDAMRSGDNPKLAWDIVERLNKHVPDKSSKVDITSDGDKLESPQAVVMLPDNGKRDDDGE
jgi:hypothetical protein